MFLVISRGIISKNWRPYNIQNATTIPADVYCILQTLLLVKIETSFTQYNF